jgi:DNA-binding NarL/FixJ family response regulator
VLPVTASADSATRPVRLLVVDDHHIVRQGLVALLATVPEMQVVAEASDGQHALALYREHQPDVTLMDLRMNTMNGVETTRAIRAEFPNARIIVLTTFDGDEDIYRALQAGARGYLLKGMDTEELLAAIRTVHSGKSRIPGLNSLLSKLGVSDRTQAATTALQRGIVHFD